MACRVYSHDVSERRRAEEALGDARELERSRLARALHDAALQGLTEAVVLAMSADRERRGLSNSANWCLPCVAWASSRVARSMTYG
ncbi:MAG: hypothetical protein M3Z95_08460 [Actinomycetota bacterium]|nr:hypothetical protein [Actinomycetota bacterium]